MIASNPVYHRDEPEVAWYLPYRNRTDYRCYDIDEQLLFDGPADNSERPLLQDVVHPPKVTETSKSYKQFYRTMIRRVV